MYNKIERIIKGTDIELVKYNLSLSISSVQAYCTIRKSNPVPINYVQLFHQQKLEQCWCF